MIGSRDYAHLTASVTRLVAGDDAARRLRLVIRAAALQLVHADTRRGAWDTLYRIADEISQPGADA